MGALKGSVTIRRYRVKGTAPREQERIVKGVRAHVHLPIDPLSDVERAHGWASIHDAEDLDLTPDKLFTGEAMTLAVRIDTLKPPSAVVRRLVDENLKQLGRRPNKAEKKTMKEDVVRQLRQKIFPQVRTYDLVWLFDSERVLFWSLQKGANEAMLELFSASFGLELVPDGPGPVAHDVVGADAARLQPTPEMVLGFAGLPGRGAAEADA